MMRNASSVIAIILTAAIAAPAQNAPKQWSAPAGRVPALAVSLQQPLPGIAEELPMNEGSGTVAHDISGNGNDATFCVAGSQPTWSAQGLVFAEVAGTKDSCLDTPLTNYQSVFAQLCPYAGAFPNTMQDYSANGPTIETIFGSTTTTDGIDFIGSPYSAHLYGIEPTLFYAPLDRNDGPTTASTVIGGCHVFAATLGTEANGTLDHLYVDGVEQPYDSQASSALRAPTTGHYTIGCSIGCTYIYDTFHFEGMIGYFVASDESYSATEVAAESAYINRAVAGRDDAVAAGAFTGNTIVAIGDSLTAGWDEQGGLGWYQLLQTDNQYTVTSLGLAGMWSVDAAAMWPSRETAYFSPNAGRQICHIWDGTNDLYFYQTPAQVWAALQKQGRECIASGGIPIIATMISRYSLDAEKNQLNALIRNGWQAAGFAAIDDLAAIPEIGADGAYANPTYFTSDGIHLTGPNGVCDTTSGYGIICTAVSSTVNQLDAAAVQAKPHKHLPIAPTERAAR